MRTTQIKILVSKKDYLKFGLDNNIISFSKLKENILQELFQKSIVKSIRFAKKTGLSEMNLEDINAEIDNVRISL